MSLTNEASEGHSIDLYREHLLNQLGRSGQWQTSLQLSEKVAPLSFEVQGETGRELRRAGSVTVPPLSALLGLCPLSPCGPTYQLLGAAGCVCRLTLCCVIERDRPVRWACSVVLKGLWLSAWPDQAVTAKYHRLPLFVRLRDYKDTECCLSVFCLSVWPAMMKLPSFSKVKIIQLPRLCLTF